jgi:hypothetical protein
VHHTYTYSATGQRKGEMVDLRTEAADLWSELTDVESEADPVHPRHLIDCLETTKSPKPSWRRPADRLKMGLAAR